MVRHALGDRRRALSIPELDVERLAVRRHRVIERRADAERAQALLKAVAIAVDAKCVLVVDVPVTGALAWRRHPGNARQALVEHRRVAAANLVEAVELGQLRAADRG